MTKLRSPLDVGLGAALIGLAAVVWWQADQLPPPMFDPIGSAAVPKTVALLIAAMSAIVVWRGFRSSPEPEPEAMAELPDGLAAPTATAEPRLRPLLALALLGLTCVYAGAMQWGGLGFRSATVGYVFLAGLLLGGLSRRVAATSGVLAIVLGVGGTYLFTRVFYIDLPQ